MAVMSHQQFDQAKMNYELDQGPSEKAAAASITQAQATGRVKKKAGRRSGADQPRLHGHPFAHRR